MKKVCGVKAKGFWFKNSTYPRLFLAAIRVTDIVVFTVAKWLACNGLAFVRSQTQNVRMGLGS